MNGNPNCKMLRKTQRDVMNLHKISVTVMKLNVLK